jgi:hypothetical protein
MVAGLRGNNADSIRPRSRTPSAPPNRRNCSAWI